MGIRGYGNEWDHVSNEVVWISLRSGLPTSQGEVVSTLIQR